MTKVVNGYKHMRTENDVYIGRSSVWGNPFKIGPDGTREEVVALYEALLQKKILAGVIKKEDIMALEGKTLVCFCAPLACHGDVLVKTIKALSSE